MDHTTLQKRASEHFQIKETDAGLILRPRMRSCEDCGEMVMDRSKTYALKLGYKGRQTWDVRCSGCGLKTTVSSPLQPTENK
jgi:hypothetical protein